MRESEVFGMGEVPREERMIERAPINNPPWWAWAIISILVGEAAWFANTTVTLQAQVAALSAKSDAQYAALDDNVNRLMNSWERQQ